MLSPETLAKKCNKHYSMLFLRLRGSWKECVNTKITTNSHFKINIHSYTLTISYHSLLQATNHAKAAAKLVAFCVPTCSMQDTGWAWPSAVIQKTVVNCLWHCDMFSCCMLCGCLHHFQEVLHTVWFYGRAGYGSLCNEALPLLSRPLPLNGVFNTGPAWKKKGKNLKLQWHELTWIIPSSCLLPCIPQENRTRIGT